MALSLTAMGCRDEDAQSVDTATFDRGSAGVIDVMNALAVSDAMFAFDPTLDPSMSAEANAMAVRDHVAAIPRGCCPMGA